MVFHKEVFSQLSFCYSALVIVPKSVKCVLYADVTNLFVESITIDGLYTIENKVDVAYTDWFFANRLTHKTIRALQAIFRVKQKNLPPHYETLKLDDSIVKCERML